MELHLSCTNPSMCYFPVGVEDHFSVRLLYCLWLTWCVFSLQVSSTISESVCCIVYDWHEVLFPCRCRAPCRRVAVVLFMIHMIRCFPAGVEHHLGECLLYCLWLTWGVFSLQVSSTMSEGGGATAESSSATSAPTSPQYSQLRVTSKLPTHSLWNRSQVEATKHHWWEINICSGSQSSK